jgi:hypothetical protein
VNGREETQRFEVILTGAFLTGQPLKVRVAEYSQLQRDLGEDLTSHASGGWDYESIKWRDVPSYKYGGGGYSSLVPLVLVQRNGEQSERPLYKRKPKGLSAVAWRPVRAAACDVLIQRIADLRRASPPLDLRSHPVTAQLLDERIAAGRPRLQASRGSDRRLPRGVDRCSVD